MKTIHRIIFSFACLLIVQATLMAQTSTPEERAQKWTDWMKKELALTEDQIPKVHAVNLKYAQENESLRTKDTGRRGKFSALKDNDKAKDEELKPILSEEQFKRYQEKKKEKQKEILQNAKANRK